MKVYNFYRGLAEVSGMTHENDILKGVGGKKILRGKGDLALPSDEVLNKGLREGLMIYTPSRESLTGGPSITLKATVSQSSLFHSGFVYDTIMDAIDTVQSKDNTVKKSVNATKIVSVKCSAKAYSDITKVLTKAVSTAKPYLVKYVLSEKHEGEDNIYYRRVVAATSPLITIVDNKIKAYKTSMSKKTPTPVILGVKLSKKTLEALSVILHNVLDEILEYPEGSDNPTSPYTAALLSYHHKTISILESKSTGLETTAVLGTTKEHVEKLLTMMSKKNPYKKIIYSIENTEGNASQTKKNEIKPIVLEEEKPKKIKKGKKKKAKKSEWKKATVENIPPPPPQQPTFQQRDTSMFNGFNGSNAPQQQQQAPSMGTRRIPVAGRTTNSEPAPQEAESLRPPQQPQQPNTINRPGNNQIPTDKWGYPLEGKKLKKWEKKQKKVRIELQRRLARKAELERELMKINAIIGQQGQVQPQQPPSQQGFVPFRPQGQQPPQQGGWGQPQQQQSPWGQPQQQSPWGQHPPQQVPWGQQQQSPWGQPPQQQQVPWGQQQQQSPWGQPPQQQQVPWGQPQQQSPWGQHPPQQQGAPNIVPMGQTFSNQATGQNPNMVKQVPMGGTSNSGDKWRTGV